MGFYDVLREAYPGLSKGRKRVAEYLMDHRNDAAFISAAVLAEKTDLSEASVGRFAVTLGYGGYKDMQSAIQKEVMQSMDVVTRIKQSAPAVNDTEGVFQKVFNDDLDNINATCQNIDFGELDAIADLLIQSKNIGVAAIRAGTSVGTILQLFLNQILGNAISLYPGIYDARDKMKNWGENDTVIAVLYYRNSGYLEQVLQFAKRRKCKVVLFTNDLSLNVVQYADHIIRPEVGGPIISYTASVMIANALLAIVLNKIGVDSQRMFDELYEYEDILSNL